MKKKVISLHKAVALANDTAALNVRDLPQELRAGFKSACARRSRSMRGITFAVMRDLMKDPRDPTRVIDLGKLSRTYPNPR